MRKATCLLTALGVIAATLAALALSRTLRASDTGDIYQAALAPNPVLADNGGTRNVVFYYGGHTDLTTADAGEVRSTLGAPSVVVTTRSKDEAATVASIHAAGAKAYRYVQFYWSPATEDYDGLDLSDRPELAYCRTGDDQAGGVKDTSGGDQWWYIDANERAVRAHFSQKFAVMREQGWDGVFIDRGEAATRYAADAGGNSIWHRKSSCTEDPHREGATFADAFVDLIGEAHANGLQAMMNNGKSPYDPIAPMRPDPSDADCRAGDWAACRIKNDVWAHSDLILNETASRPKDQLWQRTFVGNRRSERHAQHGRRTVALITTSTVGGAENQNRRNVLYAWSRVKLFDVPVAVNTGTDGCPVGSTICNQYGIYPDLVNVAWGRPKLTGPQSRGCARAVPWRCVWTRHYAGGLNALNAKPVRQRGVRMSTRTRTCRFVYDVGVGKPVAGNKCVRSFRVTMAPWSGRPFLFSRGRW